MFYTNLDQVLRRYGDWRRIRFLEINGSPSLRSTCPDLILLVLLKFEIIYVTLPIFILFNFSIRLHFLYWFCTLIHDFFSALLSVKVIDLPIIAIDIVVDLYSSILPFKARKSDNFLVIILKNEAK